MAKIQRVGQTESEHVMGAVHTRTVEDFSPLIKRGVVGTRHKIDRRNPSRYVAEFQFRYNNRKNDDIFGKAVSGC